jgi:hypothetical protein
VIGAAKDVTGYVTQDKFLIGRTLAELESYLGFHKGRLARGATFVKLTRLPTDTEFELAAFSMTAAHRYAAPTGLDITKLKDLARSAWDLSGPNRLVKVLPGIAHDPTMADDDQYPPGQGVPQWRIKRDRPVPGIIVAEPKTSLDKYKPVG